MVIKVWNATVEGATAKKFALKVAQERNATIEGAVAKKATAMVVEERNAIVIEEKNAVEISCFSLISF
jgi:hypothetical protein